MVDTVPGFCRLLIWRVGTLEKTFRIPFFPTVCPRVSGELCSMFARPASLWMSDGDLPVPGLVHLFRLIFSYFLECGLCFGDVTLWP
jgi:hypothetical protein